MPSDRYVSISFRNTDIIRLFAGALSHIISALVVSFEKKRLSVDGTLFEKECMVIGVVVDMKMYSILNCDKAQFIVFQRSFIY